MSAIKGARPIRNSEIGKFHSAIEQLDTVSLDTYSSVFRNWIENSKNKTLVGLDQFPYADYTQGTSQAFDNFVIKHSKNRTIATLPGDFQYHACLGKFVDFAYINEQSDFTNTALIISAPFSDLGVMHPDFDFYMDYCEKKNISVCLDLAYWGIAKNINIDLNKYSAIKEVTCSLSKPFYTLENHRIGIRFTRNYADDGISMINEVNMQNNYSMALGVKYMNTYTADYNWQTYSDAYYDVCKNHCLTPTDTVIFGTSSSTEYNMFNRGIPGNNRVCVSSWLNNE